MQSVESSDRGQDRHHSLSIVQYVSLLDSNVEGCNIGGAHARLCALLGLPVSWSASTAPGSGSPDH